LGFVDCGWLISAGISPSITKPLIPMESKRNYLDPGAVERGERKSLRSEREATVLGRDFKA